MKLPASVQTVDGGSAQSQKTGASGRVGPLLNAPLALETGHEEMVASFFDRFLSRGCFG